jgi:two-component SAPR family response regulator
MTNHDLLQSIHAYIDERVSQALILSRDKQLEKALTVSIEAIDSASKHNYQAGKGRALGVKGRVLYQLFRFDEALDSFYQALDIFQEIGDAFHIAHSLQALGSVHFASGQLPLALEEFLNAFSVLELAGLERNSLVVLGNIVLTYHSLGELLHAIQYSHKRLALAREYGSEYQTAKALENLGELHFRIADYATSFEYSNQAIEIAVANKFVDVESGVLANIGAVYYHLENYTSALDSMMRSIAVAEQLNNNHILAPLYNFVCCVYGKMNNDSLALDYAMRALAIHTAYSEPVGEAYTLHNIACVFEQNGDITTALEYAHKSRSLFHNSSVKEGEAETLLLIATCNQKINNHLVAFEYAETALTLAESINSHKLILSALNQLQYSANLIGDTLAAAKYSRRLTATSKIIAKEEQRRNAEKLLLEAQIQKTRSQVQQLMNSAKTSLTDDFLNKTNSLNHQGFVLATVTLTDSAKKSTAASVISVKTFGHFSVTIANRELTTDDWQRKKARDIFKILLINHRKSVTIDELIDFLWPNSESKNLIPTLWNSVSYIRKALEPDIKPHTQSAYINIMDKSYMLDLGTNASIDFLQFKHLISKSGKENNIEAKITLLEQAAALYVGDFLKEDSFEEWAAFERESMKELFLEAIMEIGNYYLDNGKLSEAIFFARKAIEADKVYEDAYKLLFTALADNDQVSELTKAWKLCQTSYKKELGTNPPAFLEKLIVL